MDIIGHWYLEIDDLQRIKDWQPKDPNDPFEMFPRIPRMTLAFDETVDEHGNRTFKYKYRYDFTDPHGGVFPAYPYAHMYQGGKDGSERIEAYGFKQGELLRADAEEEEIIRRIMEEEDREWERVERTELVQEPWNYPGKIRPDDFIGHVDRAKKKWRENVKAGRPTDPSKDPDYDLVQAGEYVIPRDGPRAEWRHLWFENRTGSTEDKKLGRDLKYRTTNNEGMSVEANESNPEPYPDYISEVKGAEKYTRTTRADGTPLHDQTIPMPPLSGRDESPWAKLAQQKARASGEIQPPSSSTPATTSDAPAPDSEKKE